jgi:para-nitrobenzyl esterase
MSRTLHGLIVTALVGGAITTATAPIFAADAAAPAKPTAPAASATSAAHYSVETTLVGKMLDDPAAVEVLKKMIPTVYANEMFQSMGRESTLKSIQQYEPEALSDANLAKLQAELNKIPAKP